MKGGRRVLGLFPELPPLISVIIANYNGGATLGRALKSVVAQTFSRIEIIIIDGGSSDGTLDILRKFDDIVDYWVSEPDNGVYDALNKGIDFAHGDWMYFLGSDDNLEDHNILQRLLSFNSKSKMIYGNVILANTNTIYDGEFTRYKLCTQNICQQAILYHRNLFEKLGKFNLKYSLYADWEFNIKCFACKDANPQFMNVIVAKYGSEGMSCNKMDDLFIRDQLNLIRNILGIRYYLWLLPSKIYDKTYDRLHALWHTVTDPIRNKFDKS